MRHGTIVILIGWLVASGAGECAVAGERNVIRHLPDRPDKRRECTDRKCKVFRTLPSWHKPDADSRQETKGESRPVFRLL